MTTQPVSEQGPILVNHSLVDHNAQEPDQLAQVGGLVGAASDAEFIEEEEEVEPGPDAVPAPAGKWPVDGGPGRTEDRRQFAPEYSQTWQLT